MCGHCWLQECLRIFEASKEVPQHTLEGGHHVITHIPHMEGMGGEQVDPGHDPGQLAAAPPLEQTYQHDALAHHQAMVRSPRLRRRSQPASVQGQEAYPLNTL